MVIGGIVTLLFLISVGVLCVGVILLFLADESNTGEKQVLRFFWGKWLASAGFILLVFACIISHFKMLLTPIV